MTHAEISLSVSRWLLQTQRWACYVAREVGYASGQVDILAMSSIVGQALTPEHAKIYKAQREAAGQRLPLPLAPSPGEAVADPLKWRRNLGDYYLAQYTDEEVSAVLRAPPPRVHVVEVKASRADLLADLRARKAHTYEPWCTHLSLAGPDAVIRGALAHPAVPARWGLFVVDGPRVTVLRQSERMRRGSPRMQLEALHRLLVSSSWRSINQVPDREPAAILREE